MMHLIYLLIRATFSQKTYDACNLLTYSCYINLKIGLSNALKFTYLFVFHSPKKKEEEEEEDEGEMIKKYVLIINM